MIIDSHCHIDFSEFDNDRKDVLKRASSQGVEKIIIPGVMKNTWQRIKLCCEKNPQLYPCYGLHPYFVKNHKPEDLESLRQWVTKNKTIAIGECGLDFFLKDLDRKLQQFYFEEQLDIALEFNLPVVIHARKSTEDVINTIKKRPSLQGMIHSYSGSYEQAKQLIELNFYISIGSSVTYENSSRIRKIVQALPLEHILIETDAPDQPVAKSKSRRNEPVYIIDVIDTIATLQNTDRKTVSNITTKNAMELFRLV